MWRYSVIVISLLVPACSQAAVTINEVAWMGSADSPNDEWVELYNDGAAVDVTDWVLSDGMALDIVLSGTIPASGYAVLERTDDTSAPGAAFLVYTGALPNTGATLTLYRADGGIEDMVAGGVDWENIGGDNTTKDTAQYTTTGWVTDVATPGAANGAGRSVAPPTTATTKPVARAGGNIATPVPTEQTVLNRVPRTPVLAIAGPRTAYVNQPVMLRADASGLAEPLLASLLYRWNLGDLSIAAGREVTHTFAYPGEYAVTVEATYRDYKASAQQAIVVLPTPLALTVSDRGELQLHNVAKYEVDVSGFMLVADGQRLTVPAHTTMLPNATITISRDRLRYQPGVPVIVLDRAGEIVLTYGQESTSAGEPVVTRAGGSPGTLPPVSTEVESLAPGFGFAAAEPVVVPVAAAAASVPDVSLVANGAAATPPLHPSYPYLALAGLIAVALLGVLVRVAPAPVPVEAARPPRTGPFFDDAV